MDGCEFQTQDATNGLTEFSDEPRTKARFTFHYDFLLGGNRVPYNKLEAQPTKVLGAPKRPQKASTATKGITRHKRHLGSKDPRVTSSQTFTSTNLRGEHKPMHNAMARAQVLKSFTLKSHQKQLMLMGGEERKN